MITTSYGSWSRVAGQGGGSLTLHGTVEQALGNWPGIDVDAVAADYRTAINQALPPPVSLCGDEFYGPAGYEVVDWESDGYPVDEDGALDIAAVVDSVNFWAIVNRHDTGE